MKLDAALLTTELALVPERAAGLQAAGVDGVFSFDGPLEPFQPLLLAAEHAPRLELMTGVAIALARTPMLVAQLAHALSVYSKGRFLLGLGPQIRAHIERRFGAPWSRPAARMHEFVRALHAIFACWNDGAELKFEGEFWRHTLMPPLLRPSPSPFGRPRILLAGVGPAMVEVAGEVADGLVVHPFHTERSLRELTLPALARGRSRAGASAAPFDVACQVLVVTGETEDQLSVARGLIRQQIAFYASTPAYSAVLDLEGRGDLQPELRTLTRAGRWAELADRVDDELLERVAIVGEPALVAQRLTQRYAGVATRIGLASPFPIPPGALRAIAEGLRS